MTKKPTKSDVVEQLRDTTETLKQVCEACGPAIIEHYGAEAYCDGILKQVAVAQVTVRLCEEVTK